MPRRHDSSSPSSADQRKKSKMEIDRISNLPSEITQKILSYLPIKEAGKTSALSRNWRFQWSMVPSLEFDLDDDPCNVDHVLLLHKAPIHSFKLRAKDFSDNYDLGRWILYLSRHPIKQFVLKGYRGKRSYNVSSSLFACQDLSHLTLSRCSLSLPCTFEGFRMLKSLDIKRVIIPHHDLEKLIASSPLLERLTLRHLKGITHLKIDAPKLQFLKLRGKLQDAVELTKSLTLVHHVSLEPKQAYGKWHRLLRITPAIRELEISLWSLDSQENEATSWDFPKLQRVKVTGFSCTKFQVDFVKLMFLSCPDLQELEIVSVDLELEGQLRIKGDYYFKLSYSTQLQLLKVTGLYGRKIEVEFIKFLLLSSPVLQKLHIVFEEKRKKSSGRRNWRLDDDDMGDRNCTFNQLQVMNIGGFSRAEDIGFIKFLLRRAPMLQQLTLQPQSANVSWEACKLLNEFKFNSVQANLQLMDPLNPSDDSPSRPARSRSPVIRRRRNRSPTPISDYESDDSDSDDY